MSVDPQHITDIPHIMKYFIDIGIEEPIQQRIQLLYSYIQKIIPFTLKDVFVNDHIDEDETHKFNELDFYTDKNTFTLLNFIRSNVFVISPPDLKIASMKIDSHEYDFEKASAKSRVRVRLVYFNTERVYGELRATGNNCDYLMRILGKHFIPRII